MSLQIYRISMQFHNIQQVLTNMFPIEVQANMSPLSDKLTLKEITDKLKRYTGADKPTQTAYPKIDYISSANVTKIIASLQTIQRQSQKYEKDNNQREAFMQRMSQFKSVQTAPTKYESITNFYNWTLSSLDFSDLDKSKYNNFWEMAQQSIKLTDKTKEQCETYLQSVEKSKQCFALLLMGNKHNYQINIKKKDCQGAKALFKEAFDEIYKINGLVDQLNKTLLKSDKHCYIKNTKLSARLQIILKGTKATIKEKITQLTEQLGYESKGQPTLQKLINLITKWHQNIQNIQNIQNKYEQKTEQLISNIQKERYYIHQIQRINSTQKQIRDVIEKQIWGDERRRIQKYIQKIRNMEYQQFSDKYGWAFVSKSEQLHQQAIAAVLSKIREYYSIKANTGLLEYISNLIQSNLQLTDDVYYNRDVIKQQTYKSAQKDNALAQLTYLYNVSQQQVYYLNQQIEQLQYNKESQNKNQQRLQKDNEHLKQSNGYLSTQLKITQNQLESIRNQLQESEKGKASMMQSNQIYMRKIKRYEDYFHEHQKIRKQFEQTKKELKACEQKLKPFKDIINCISACKEKLNINNNNIRINKLSSNNTIVDYSDFFNEIEGNIAQKNKLQRQFEQFVQQSFVKLNNILKIINSESINEWLKKTDTKTKQSQQKFIMRALNTIHDHQYRISDTSLTLIKPVHCRQLYEELTNCLGTHNIGFRLLYRQKPESEGHLIDCLANQPYNLLLVRTKRGHILAGFSTLSYCQGQDAPTTKAFMFSTFAERAYHLMKGCQPVKLQEGNIVYGNYQIKVSPSKKVMTCNIGTDSYFEQKATNMESLLGQKSHDVQIELFEVYRVIFAEEQVRAIKEVVTQKYKYKEKQKYTETSVMESSTKIQALQKQLATLKADCERYKQTISNLKSKKGEKKEQTNKQKTQQQRDVVSQNKQLQKEYKQLWEKVKQLEKQISQKTKQLKVSQNKISQLQKSIIEMKHMEQQRSQYKGKLQELEGQIKQLRKSNEQKEKYTLRDEQAQMKESKNTLQRELDETTIALNNIKEQLSSKQSEIIQKTMKVQQLNAQLENMTKLIEQKKTEEAENQERRRKCMQEEQKVKVNLDSLYEQMQRKQQELDDLVMKVKTKQNNLNRVPKQTKQLKTETNLQNQVKMMAQKIEESKKQITAIQAHISKTENQLKQKQTQVQRITVKIRDNEQILTQQQQHLQKVTKSVDAKYAQLMKLNNQIDQKKRNISPKNILGHNQLEKVEAKQHRGRKLQQTQSTQTMTESTTNNTQKPTQLSYSADSFFVGQVITAKQHKLFLMKALQEHCPLKPITRTELLYTYPQMGELSFHKYVDNKPNYILLIRVKTGHIIAAYSQLELSTDAIYTEENNGGFLASITNREIFTLDKKNPKAKVAAYAPYHILFGNSELRIQHCSTKIESSMGKAFKFFDTSKHRDPSVIFGSPERESVIDCYEIYQLL